ncbi:hypothetical protein V8C34DRAFT_326732 [Trichoderma compactum]
MKWMVITVLFPELILIRAILEFHMAWKALRLMGEKQKPVEWPWWFRNPPLPWLPCCRRYWKDKDLESQGVRSRSKKENWTLVYCYFANMSGSLSVAGEKRLPVTAQQLAEDPSHIHPENTKGAIGGKSKQDWLAKLSSKNERAIELKNDRPASHDVSKTEADDSRFFVLQSDETYDKFWEIMVGKQTAPKKTDSSKCQKAPRIPNDNIPIYKSNNDVHPAVYVLALASGLFGAMDAIAWHIPTEAEKLLWQIATSISAASPVVGLLVIPFAQFTKASGNPELFAGNSLRLMQEYTWHASNMSRTTNAIKKLEDAIANGRFKKYSDILLASETRDDTLILDLGDFLGLEGRFGGSRSELFELHDDKKFARNFDRLVDVVNGQQTNKIDDAARINAWPRQPLLPHQVTQGILYVIGFLYCASRLILLAI